MSYSVTKTDGSKTAFTANSLFSNSAFRGLTVDGTTKTTTSGLRVLAGQTEPNPDSITATGDALGAMIGTAARSAAGIK